MVAQDFFDLLSRFNPATSVGVEDFSDRFNFLFTVITLLLCTLVVTVKQYLLRPISCYMSTTVGGFNLVNYVENYCWIHGTYPISIDNELYIHKKAWNKLEKDKMDYYQWVPFMLSLQCILFYLPRLFWQSATYYRTGIDLQHLVARALDGMSAPTREARDTFFRHVARTLERQLFFYRDHRRGVWARAGRDVCWPLAWLCGPSRRLGCWLVSCYALTKLLSLSNALGQVYLMQRFLATNCSFFGLRIAGDLLAGRDWRSTMIFPRVTFCHVALKGLGATNHVVAQCVLPVNMLNEKIYVFLWFWVLCCCCLTALSIPMWVLRVARLKANVSFVRKYLELAEVLEDADRPLVVSFARNFLRHDGVFILRMLSINAGDLATSEVVLELWAAFKENYKHRDFACDARSAIRLEPSAPTADAKSQLTTASGDAKDD